MCLYSIYSFFESAVIERWIERRVHEKPEQIEMLENNSLINLHVVFFLQYGNVEWPKIRRGK